MSDSNEWLERSVDDLELSVRTMMSLQNAGIERVGQLVTLSAEDLARLKFSAASVRELGELLSELGLGLRAS